MNLNIFITLISVLFNTFQLIQASDLDDEQAYHEAVCGADQWNAYKDEKCFAYFPTANVLTYDDANKYCQGLSDHGAMVKIGSQEEQSYLDDYLYKVVKVVNSVWIGARRTNGSFLWSDGTTVEFTNWDDKNPKNDTDFDCVELNADSSQSGKWVNVRCNKQNFVICEKMQTISINALQKIFLETRKQLMDENKEIKQTLVTVQSDLAKKTDQLVDINNNRIPIGFIYAQLSGQDEPTKMWQGFEWTEISSQYAGQFFRVLGGQSDSFGKTQAGVAPRVSNVNAGQFRDPIDKDWSSTLNLNSVSERIITGTNYMKVDGWYQYLTFTTTGDEVRPTNQAMKLWKRTK